jgi:hypothetical protein
MGFVLKYSFIFDVVGEEFIKTVLDGNQINYLKTVNQPCIGFQNLIHSGHSNKCIPYEDEKYQNTINKRAVFIQHPLTWYQDYWIERMLKGWRIGQQEDGSTGCILDEATYSKNFQEWIGNLISFTEMTPQIQFGICTVVFDVYLSESSFAGKIENIQEDLEKFLWMYEKEVITRWPERVNEGSREFKAMAKYRPDQAEKLMELEAPLVNKFGYNYIPNGVLEEEGVKLYDA